MLRPLWCLLLGRFGGAVLPYFFDLIGGDRSGVIPPTGAHKSGNLGHLLVAQTPAKVRHGESGRGFYSHRRT